MLIVQTCFVKLFRGQKEMISYLAAVFKAVFYFKFTFFNESKIGLSYKETNVHLHLRTSIISILRDNSTA